MLFSRKATPVHFFLIAQSNLPLPFSPLIFHKYSPSMKEDLHGNINTIICWLFARASFCCYTNRQITGKPWKSKKWSIFKQKFHYLWNNRRNPCWKVNFYIWAHCKLATSPGQCTDGNVFQSCDDEIGCVRFRCQRERCRDIARHQCKPLNLKFTLLAALAVANKCSAKKLWLEWNINNQRNWLQPVFH